MTIAERIGRLNAQLEDRVKVTQFITLARCLVLARGREPPGMIARQAGVRGPVLDILEGRKVWDAARSIREKAAVAAGSTTDPTWAGPLANYQVLANAFLESLQNFGAFDRLLPSMRRVPMRTRIGAATAGASGAAGLLQAQLKPISNLTLSGGTVDERKALALLVVTAELARFSDPAAGNLFQVELSNAVTLKTDVEFITVLSASASTIGSSGVTAEHVRNDLRALLGLVTTSARSSLFLITTSAIAKVLSVLHANTGAQAFEQMTPAGGSISGIPVVVSDGVPSGQIILVDAYQVAAANDTIELDVSSEATLNMDTAPDSPPSASTVMTSLWQNDDIGLKAERYFGVTKLTTTGVGVLTGANYSGDSPGP